MSQIPGGIKRGLSNSYIGIANWVVQYSVPGVPPG
jgi:hypothetical protein